VHEEIQTGSPGHVHVRQNEIEVLVVEKLEGFGSGGGRPTRIAVAIEEFDYGTPNLVVVFYNEGFDLPLRLGSDACHI
jgi:hypothetical protein